MFRRKSHGRHEEQLQRLPDERRREQVVEWWDLAQARSGTERGDLSWLTDHVATEMAFGSEANVRPAVLLVALRMGYALRVLVGRFATPKPLDVSMLDRNHIPSLASCPRDDAGTLATEDLSAAEADLLVRIFELVGETAVNVDRFGELISVEIACWNALDAIAIDELQQMAERGGLVESGQDLDAGIAKAWLRLGFVLRCLDEALEIKAPGDEPE